ncbi:MAG: hypothetical protein IKY52_03505 [Clostridia bacterium]|nr:hypothetical protein [Clostridia bacterium]
MEMQVINIESRREVFWDDYLIDTEMTTAVHRLIPPVERECCFVFDQEEENFSVSYPNIIQDEYGYRMYYLSFNPNAGGNGKIRMRVIESADGIHWTRPMLNLFPAEGTGSSNVVVDDMDDSSLCVFLDTNPVCPPEEKYKALSLVFLDRAADRRSLWSYTSPDGYHFQKNRMVTDQGRFDTLNATFYSHVDGLYHMFCRNLHSDGAGGIVRDVRMMTSPDFVNWSAPVQLEYDDGMDFQIYTNNIMQYPRAPHMYVGMPSRYVERKAWTKNDDQFGSAEVKKRAAKDIEPRCALAVTDMMFICSRDGQHFHRYQDAYMTPGLETEDNWIYGDCFSSYPLTDTGSTYSFFMNKNEMTGNCPNYLYRYELRKDGFACMTAECGEKLLVTKPFCFTGSTLHLNVATSAFGSVYVEVLDAEGNCLSGKSMEVYGDSLDRIVYFEDESDFSAYAGRPVRLRFRMTEAKLYSMYFDET